MIQPCLLHFYAELCVALGRIAVATQNYFCVFGMAQVMFASDAQQILAVSQC